MKEEKKKIYIWAYGVSKNSLSWVMRYGPRELEFILILKSMKPYKLH